MMNWFIESMSLVLPYVKVTFAVVGVELAAEAGRETRLPRISTPASAPATRSLLRMSFPSLTGVAGPRFVLRSRPERGLVDHQPAGVRVERRGDAERDRRQVLAVAER